jgi:hypothetical protein
VWQGKELGETENGKVKMETGKGGRWSVEFTANGSMIYLICQVKRKYLE